LVCGRSFNTIIEDTIIENDEEEDKLKLITIFMTTVLCLTFVKCTEFSTSYQHVNEGEFRMLNFWFYPADFSPGEVVTLYAAFAGKEKDLLNEIDWSISFNATVDNYGMQTAVGSDPIDRHTTAPALATTYSGNAQIAVFRLKIPEDIVRKSASIPENWTNMLPSYMVNALPKGLTARTKNQVVDLIEQLPRVNWMANGTIRGYKVTNDDGTIWELDAKLIPALLQFTTVPFIITANVKNQGRQHKIQYSHSVRYNSRFFGAPYSFDIPINNNPRIDNAVLYKVKGGNIISFDDKSGKEYVTHYLGFADTTEIYVEEGYSYFLERRSSSFDRTITMDAALSGSLYTTSEKQFSYWQFQLDKDEKKDVPFSKQMDIDNMFGRIIMPKDKAIKNVTLWVTVRDEVINERLRPRGSTLGEFQLRFVYTKPEPKTILVPDRVISQNN